MSIDLQWRYNKQEADWMLVASNLPNYRAEITAIAPETGNKTRAWAIYEFQQLLIQGTAKDTDSAKQRCSVHVSVAQEFPMFDHLPPLNGTTVS